MTTANPEELPESHEAVTRRAAEFFERQRFGEWSDTDQAELQAWLAGSISHEVAYLRIKEGATRIERLIGARSPKPDQTTAIGTGGISYRRFVLPLLAAASIALAAPFGGRFVASLMQPPDRTDSTDVGGRTLLSFSDHTEIELNTNTAMRYRMTTAERTVWLEKGEAWFHVAHDQAHPFTVFVGRHRITDLGTEFLVRKSADSVDVTLLKGKASLSGEGTQTAMLAPSDEAVATPLSLSVTRKTPLELADELAWRSGMLVFRNTPLVEVVRQFNRYNTTKLVIADPSIVNLKIMANVKTDDYESFLQLAEDVLKLRVDRERNVILISRGNREDGQRIGRRKHGL